MNKTKRQLLAVSGEISAAVRTITIGTASATFLELSLEGRSAPDAAPEAITLRLPLSAAQHLLQALQPLLPPRADPPTSGTVQ